MPAEPSLLETLRRFADDYRFDVVAVYRRADREEWPLQATDVEDLEWQLHRSGSFLPLPKEPAALANVLEVSLIDYLLQRLADVDGAEVRRGTERGYPDLEIGGPAFCGSHHALDVKIARRAAGGRRTQSRITLYTGNTYFRWPTLHWPGTFRPFQDYASHIDLIGLYDFDDQSLNRVADLEVIVAEPWRIASKRRSSTTREYIGAVQSIEALRHERGEFETEEAFYDYWRRYPFKIGGAVEQQLRRLLPGGDAA